MVKTIYISVAWLACKERYNGQLCNNSKTLLTASESLTKGDPSLDTKPFNLGNALHFYSNGGEILVQTERKGIEFLTSCICFERPELVPPMLTSVFPYLTILLVECVVQEICNNPRNKSFGRERDINHVIELHQKHRLL